MCERMSNFGVCVRACMHVCVCECASVRVCVYVYMLFRISVYAYVFTVTDIILDVSF